jgi:pimeloyl-ACP methyl ester carboxylesterase
MSTPVAATGHDGIAVRVRAGPGPPIAWLHGYTMDASVWTDLWRLLPAWTHVGIDLPGHGDSRPLASDERLDRLGRRLADLCAALGARHLVGLSFGATVALQTAIEDRGRLRSLVLGAPSIAGAPTDPDSERRYLELGELHARLGAGAHLTRLWMSSPPRIFDGARAHPELWSRLESVIGRHGWSELASGAMRSLSDHVHEDADLRRVEASTLLAVGEHDMPAFTYYAARIAGAVPGCRAVLLADAGHLSLLEQPETAASLIAEHVGAAERSLRQPSS